MQVRQFVIDALVEIGIVGADETVDPSDADLGLRFLQAMVDQFQGDRLLLYIVSRAVYPLTAGLNGYALGPTMLAPHWPGPTPVLITAVAVVEGTQDIPVLPWPSAADYYAAPDKTSPGTPSRYLFEPSPTFGRFLFWPPPATAGSVAIYTPAPLTTPLTLDTDLAFPAGGYYECWRLQLAQRLQRPFLLPPDPSLRSDAAQALALVRRLNDEGAPFSHADPGVLQGVFR